MTTTVYAVAALLAAIACLILPIETRGKELTDNVHHARTQQEQAQQQTQEVITDEDQPTDN